MIISNLMACALAACLGSFCFSPLGRVKKVGMSLALLGTVCLGLVAFTRYQEAWPMLPMFLGVVLLAFFLGCLRLVYQPSGPKSRLFRVTLDAILLLLTAAAFFFPKDFYLPFFRSNTFFAHIFFIAGAVGKALVLIAAVNALCSLSSTTTEKQSQNGLRQVLPWATWGYSCLTLSMFSGEVWSFLGWGMPVVWHDSAIAVAMTLWFYWTCILHLHYLRKCSIGLRLQLTVLGGLLIIFLGCYPELGPWDPDRFFILLH